MDLFNKKALAKLQADNAKLIADKEHDHNDIMQLLETIRTMDQMIYNMSQQTSWEEIQPIFAKLKNETDIRMLQESARIRDVLIPEMKKVYLHDKSPKKITRS